MNPPISVPEGFVRLPAVSLWQPWASLMFFDKDHETRHWPLPEHYEGAVVLIHAASRNVDRDLDPDLERLCRFRFGDAFRETMPRGVLLGPVLFTGCVPADLATPSAVDRLCGNFKAGRYAWRHSRMTPFESPIKATGRQGFFHAMVPVGAFVSRLADADPA